MSFIKTRSAKPVKGKKHHKMSSQDRFQIPTIDFSTYPKVLERGSDEWKLLSKRVRDACEKYGCFEVVCDKISTQLRAEIFSILKHLFDLPLETKKKNIGSSPFHGYIGPYYNPLYESFGIENASNIDSIKGFANLMWPNRDVSCENLSLMVKQMDELNYTVSRMILDSYGLTQDSGLMVECSTMLRMMKYKSPPNGEDMEGLPAHTDKVISTILCEKNPGLEVETKDGQWIQLIPSTNSVIFIVGDSLKASSNGRLHSVKHRVTMKGDKDRYSLAFFKQPVEEAIIKAPQELVDEEHPQLFKEFKYTDYFQFAYSKEGKAIDEAIRLQTYAGILDY